MQPHWACIGEGDWILAGARDAVASARASGAPIELAVVPGDHFASVGACVQGFVAHVLPRLAAVPEPTPPATAVPIRGLVQGVGSGPFDLVATDSGAVWIWSAFGEARVRMRRLDRLGHPTDPDPIELGVYDGSVREVAIAVHGERLGVVWVETDGRTLAMRARAASGPIEGPLGRAVTLGEVDPASMTMARGNVAIGARGEGFVAALRTTTRRGATEIAFVPIDGAMRSRRSVQLAQPCARALVGTAVAGSDLVFGLCDGTALVRAQIGDAEPVVTRIEAACSDVALVDAGGEHVVSRCDGPRSLDDRERPLVPLCEDMMPRLGRNIVLRGPASGIGAFFDGTIAPLGAPVVWTGQALIVATRHEDMLALHRSECRATGLEPTASDESAP